MPSAALYQARAEAYGSVTPTHGAPDHMLGPAQLVRGVRHAGRLRAAAVASQLLRQGLRGGAAMVLRDGKGGLACGLQRAVMRRRSHGIGLSVTARDRLVSCWRVCAGPRNLDRTLCHEHIVRDGTVIAGPGQGRHRELSPSEAAPFAHSATTHSPKGGRRATHDPLGSDTAFTAPRSLTVTPEFVGICFGIHSAPDHRYRVQDIGARARSRCVSRPLARKPYKPSIPSDRSRPLVVNPIA